MARALTAPDRDVRHMTRALRLAARARGHTSPNPLVGAVVVAGARIVGQGFHRRAGTPHAEVLALAQAGRRARGATLYLTLEPCCHTDKRTPPCVPRVVGAGVRRVVIAMADPNPRVSGRGIRQLRHAGLHVMVGCLAAEAAELNRAYAHRMRTGLPWVILKAGMTLDGQLATAGGESQWITGDAARRDAHRLRAEVDAVMTGIGTVLRDDPQLSARPGRRQVARQPVRVVLDSRLRIPLTARVLSAKGGRPIVVTTPRASRRKAGQLRALGAEVLAVASRRGRVSLRAGLQALADRGIVMVLLEGGGELNGSMLRAGLIQEMRLYVAPTLMGGQDARGLLGGKGPVRLADAIPLQGLQVSRVGSDLVISARLSTRK